MADSLTGGPQTGLVTVQVEKAGVIYEGQYDSSTGRLKLLAMVFSDGLTAKEVRAAPLGELRGNYEAELRGQRTAELFGRTEPDEQDRLAMTVNRGAGIEQQLTTTVTAFAIAEHYVGDRAVYLVAEVNGVDPSTASRWRQRAVEAGALTDQTRQQALEQWAQVRQLLNRVITSGGEQ